MSSTVRGRHVAVNGIRLHYLEFPRDAQAVIVLPGITMPAATWEFVGRRLAQNFHVILIDNRGRGLSQATPEMSYQLNDYAHDTLGLVQALKLEKAAVLGHSMGARIAIRLAAMAPGVLGRLVLADPPMTGPGRRSYPAPLDWYLTSIEKVSRGEGFDEMRASLNWPEDQINLRMQWLPTCDRKAVTDSYNSFDDEDIFSCLPTIESETLLMYAEHGDTVRDSEAADFVGRLPHGRLWKVENAGHMIPWDNPDAFHETAAKFIQTGQLP
ncbi:alpha/beta fold hydrolase [Paraburkholderia aspalathi]|uniref:alpha/beta fold hydrolase n=1 Tax=Paraburkholderia aspalathi TaxID=1324617 RepID=UPI0038B8DAF7